MPKDKRAPRLSTERRHEQILESAARLILAEGVGRCTLETTAAAAGISKALIYRHFSSREDLLKAVLLREYDMMDAHGLGGFSEAQSLERYFADYLPKVFQYLIERGPVIRAMFNDRSVANQLRDLDAARRASVSQFYRDKAEATFGVDPRLALLGVLLTANAPVASARALKSFHVEPKDAAEFWTTFLMGGWTAISAVKHFDDRD
ncbi:MAG TPA: TetR/AcrR family transcriptional regulator [Caulobacteraceae bacterium]|nr:TetR/AcrR family transcriptional regulator [Caulobacteraceae bacterium]